MRGGLLPRVMANDKRQTGAAVIFIASLLLSAALGFVGGRRARPEAEVRVKADTVRFRDTVTVERPVPILSTIIDTVLVVRPDIIVIRDTVYARLPRELKEYSGADYRAVVSGYRPSLDLIQVFPETRVVTNTVTVRRQDKRRRWSIGAQAGYGLTLRDGRAALSPYVGAGVSYSLVEW